MTHLSPLKEYRAIPDTEYTQTSLSKDKTQKIHIHQANEKYCSAQEKETLESEQIFTYLEIGIQHKR